MRAVLAVILLTAAFTLLVVIRFGLWQVRRRRGFSPGIGAFDRALYAAAALGLLVFLYGRWIEPRRLEIVRVRIATPALQRGDSVSIVHVSDLHSPSNRALQSRLPAIVAQIGPDAIAFTGDAINHAAGMESARATLRALATSAPAFGVLGNRDHVSAAAGGALDDTGFTELRGHPVDVTVNGVRISFVGASRAGDWASVRRSLRSRSDSSYVIYLGHSPDAADDVSKWGADLMLAGHTHGGQVTVPGYGAIWTASRFGKRFEAGLYRVGDTMLYINRGIGMEALLPKIRLGARPELTVIRIVSSQ